MTNTIGIMPDEWNALSAGSTLTLDRVPGERKGMFKAGDRLAVHKLYEKQTAEVTVRRAGWHGEAQGFTLEVSGSRMLPDLAYGGEVHAGRKKPGK